MWMILLLTLMGNAHDEAETCPPFPAMEKFAAIGQMSRHHEACLQRDFPSPEMRENQAWVLWLGRWKASKNRQQRDKRVSELIATSRVPDRLLWSAELLFEEVPELAKEAISRAESQVLRWRRLSYRLEQVQVLFRLKTKLEPELGAVQWVQSLRGLGVTGDFLVEAESACLTVSNAEECNKEMRTEWLTLPEERNWRACSNSAHLTVQRFGKRAYSTERDCMIHAASLAVAPGDQQSLAYWALALSMSRDEHYVTGAALRLLSAVLLTDRDSILMAAAFYRKQGDEAGAHWWEQHLK